MKAKKEKHPVYWAVMACLILILALIVGWRAKNYIETRILFAGALGEKILRHLK